MNVARHPSAESNELWEAGLQLSRICLVVFFRKQSSKRCISLRTQTSSIRPLAPLRSTWTRAGLWPVGRRAAGRRHCRWPRGRIELVCVREIHRLELYSLPKEWVRVLSLALKTSLLSQQSLYILRGNQTALSSTTVALPPTIRLIPLTDA